jgi:hypothetical protein
MYFKEDFWSLKTEIQEKGVIPHQHSRWQLVISLFTLNIKGKYQTKNEKEFFKKEVKKAWFKKEMLVTSLECRNFFWKLSKHDLKEKVFVKSLKCWSFKCLFNMGQPLIGFANKLQSQYEYIYEWVLIFH